MIDLVRTVPQIVTEYPSCFPVDLAGNVERHSVCLHIRTFRIGKCQTKLPLNLVLV